MWYPVLMILSLMVSWNPLMTDRTAIRVMTAMVIPRKVAKEMKETERLWRLDLRYRNAMKTGNFMGPLA
jgi:hypothetical protein